MVDTHNKLNNQTTYISGLLLKKMIIAGANHLADKKEPIDALNVFPVPDGDTGTNMSLTALSAAKEAEKCASFSVYEVAKAAASGALRGARGNSGVILSQLFRGFAKGLEGCENATIDDFVNAFNKASETAYKAVMKPKEGTILTVAREMAEKSLSLSFDTDDIIVFLHSVFSVGEEILLKTTDMLPQLKQAGVVDAGGQGLLVLLKGGLDLLLDQDKAVSTKDSNSVKESSVSFSALSTISHDDITYAYCTEFFINVPLATDPLQMETTENQLKTYLETIGDSIVVVSDEDIIKIHVHTNNPGKALEKALAFGELANIKIENMKIQHTNATGIGAITPTTSKPLETEPETKAKDFTSEMQTKQSMHEIERKPFGFVSVSAGNGFKKLYENLGADAVIEGGQTMNPSAEDIAIAANSIHAETVVILPNNKNIILAAQQAKFLCEGKEILVLPTKSVCEGVAALVAYAPFATKEDNMQNMEEAIKRVHTGQITYAVRDTILEDKKISAGDFLFLLDGNITHVSTNLQEGGKQLLAQMIHSDSEVVTIYTGEESTESDALELLEYVQTNFPHCEVEIQHGEQPLYYYIFSVE